MEFQDKEIKEALKDGSYYTNSRAWYSTLYMSIISERFFYIVLTSIAAVTFLLGIMSLSSFLPIVPAMPFLYESNDVLGSSPRISKVRDNEIQTVDQALRRFFVNKYLLHRENYHSDKITENNNFIVSNSDSKTYSAYYRYINSSNPKSPISLYGAGAQKTITIKNINITKDLDNNQKNNSNESSKYYAKITFISDVAWHDRVERTKWESIINFDYQNIKTTEKSEEEHKKTGQALTIEPMLFKVTGYKSRQQR